MQARERTQTKSLGEVDSIKEILGSEKLSTSKKIDERTGIVFCQKLEFTYLYKCS